MDLSKIIVLVLTAIAVFFLVYAEMRSRRNSSNTQQSGSSETAVQTQSPERNK